MQNTEMLVYNDFQQPIKVTYQEFTGSCWWKSTSGGKTEDRVVPGPAGPVAAVRHLHHMK